MEKEKITIDKKKAVSVQEYVTSAALELIRLYSQEVEKISLSEESKERLAMLRETNLTLTETFKEREKEEIAVTEQNQWVEQVQEGVKFLRECFRRFGTGIRLITYDDFYSLLEKYGLAIAPLAFYRGSIPDENLRDAAQATNTLSYISKSGVVGRHIKRAAYEKGCNRVRFFKPKERYYEWDYVESKMYIAAPMRDIDFHKLGRTPYGLKDAMGLDPLVYTYTDFGVLIFTAWGEEADDAVFEKYKALNEAIQNLPNKSLSSRIGRMLGSVKRPSLIDVLYAIMGVLILAMCIPIPALGVMGIISYTKQGGWIEVAVGGVFFVVGIIIAVRLIRVYLNEIKKSVYEND